MTVVYRPEQIQAVRQLQNGSILAGGVGSGKTLTSLAWYLTSVCNAASFKEGGSLAKKKVKGSPTLYVITTAKKRDSLEWEEEAARLGLSTDPACSFTGSSIVDITKNEGDLSRRAVMYELKGLSFREYLDLAEDIRFNELSLEEILDENFVFSELFPSDFKPYEYFNEYLKTGYYPFFLESKITYYQRLIQLVRLVVELDMAEIKGLDIRQSKKILQLLYIISQQVPFSPNLSDLARKTTIHRNSLNDYLYYLEEARLLYLLQPKNYSVASLQKPEKIYLNNTNLLYALSEDNPNSGTIREVFFYNQLAGLHQISQSKEADFLVDNKYTFEIGGKNKTMTQIKNVENSWLVKDDIIQPTGRAIPLWMFGFLY